MVLSLGLLVTGHDLGAHVRRYTWEIYLHPLLPLLSLDKLNIGSESEAQPC